MNFGSRWNRSALSDSGTPRPSKLVRVVGGVLCSTLLIVSGPWSAWSQSENSVVGTLTVEGNHRIQSSAILEKITLKTGDPMTPQVVREQIQKIYDMGFFEDVQVRTDATPDGVTVTFVVREKPFVLTSCLMAMRSCRMTN